MADVVLTNPPTMAAPGGHYSHAVTAGGFVFVSGQLPIAPDGTKLNDAPFERQAQLRWLVRGGPGGDQADGEDQVGHHVGQRRAGR